MSRGALLAVASLVSAAACASALKVPTEVDALSGKGRFADITVEQLRAGRAAYIERCAGCHHLYLPEERSPERWPAIVEDMASRTKISAKQVEEIQRYLVVMSLRNAGSAEELQGLAGRNAVTTTSGRVRP